MGAGMIQHRHKLFPRLPANQSNRLEPLSANSLQHAPIPQDQGSADFLNCRVRQCLNHNFRTNARRIAHGDGDDRFTRHKCRTIALDEKFNCRACDNSDAQLGYFEEKGFNESNMLEPPPFSDSLG